MGIEMQTGKLSRKERELQRHRRQILGVALNMFSEKGFHGVTMNDIARESEFAVGTLYKFFKSKEDLYGALLLEKIDEMQDTFHAALEGDKDEIDSIRGFLEALIRLTKKNASFFQLYLAEVHGTGPAALASIDIALKERREREITRLAGVFERGVRNKVFRDFDPFLMAAALDGMISGLIIQYLTHGERHPLDAETIMEMFLGPIVLAQPRSRDEMPGNPTAPPRMGTRIP